MWLNIFRPQGIRPLSPTELLALFSAGRTTYKPAKEIIEEMRKRSRNWQPEAGTVYPALHRLVDKGLLEKSPDRKTSFMVSERGYLFMSSISNEIGMQLEESIAFFQTVLEGIIDLNPFEAEPIITKGEKILETGLKDLQKLKSAVVEEKIRGDWKTVDVEFD